MTVLRHRTGETVQCGVLDGREVVYVERLESPRTLRLFIDIGRRIGRSSLQRMCAKFPGCAAAAIFGAVIRRTNCSPSWPSFETTCADSRNMEPRCDLVIVRSAAGPSSFAAKSTTERM